MLHRWTFLFPLPAYFLLTILIGWASRNRNRTANSFLNATNSLSLPIVTLAYLAANSSALDIIGLSATAAHYGVQAFHFYWIGSIPAMVFLALWMMPIYRRSNVLSVPHYLELRYGKPARLINACIMAIVMVLFGGIGLYAMAQVLGVATGIGFVPSIICGAMIVMIYVIVGGVRATIYNEVFQLLVITAGLVPLAIRSARILLQPASTLQSFSMSNQHLWKGMPFADKSAPFDGIGVVFGLGFVLSFGYWCTDFVLMQRAFSARTEEAAREVPLWAGFGKLFFSLLVVLPGLAAERLFPTLGASGRLDQALPRMMLDLESPLLLTFGLTAIAASLMSGLAANVSAFAALWTEDIYRAWLRPDESDKHYLQVGKWAIVAAVLLSLLTSYLNFLFRDLMEHIQLILSIFGAPFAAVFFLGMSSQRVKLRGAMIGLGVGTMTGLLHLVAYVAGWLHYGSTMNANFYAAIYSFSAACITALLIPGPPSATSNHPNLTFQWKLSLDGNAARLLILSCALIGCCLLANLLCR